MKNSLDTFNKRYALSEVLIEYLPKILNHEDCELIKFGSETITKDSEALTEFIRLMDSRKNYSSMLVKFAPDFILYDKKRNELFFRHP